MIPSRQRLLSPAACLLVGVMMLTACGANIKETHYFGRYRASSETPVNFYKVTVTADTSFTNARYVAGFYDERAVDLFFNELKPETPPDPFKDSQKDPGTDETIKPLSPDDEKGRFVMILSTNADDIAGALGALTENEAAMQALANLVNKGELEKMQWNAASVPGQKQTSTALRDRKTA